jgi:hypothetical protein
MPWVWLLYLTTCLYWAYEACTRPPSRAKELLIDRHKRQATFWPRHDGPVSFAFSDVEEVSVETLTCKDEHDVEQTFYRLNLLLTEQRCYQLLESGHRPETEKLATLLREQFNL